MIVELISVGTEILMGNITNTNATYLSKKCADFGLSVFHHSVVGDNKNRLIECVKQAYSRSDIIILTGGLGPTKDDLTKEAVAEALNRKMVESPEAKKTITDYYNRRKITDIKENNWNQAMIMEGAQVLYNENGTAPGLLLEDRNDAKTVILLPGPPNEMKPLFEKFIEPYFKKQQTDILFSKMVKISGIGESTVETMIEDLIDHQVNPTIAPYAKACEVHLRITAKAKSESEAEKLLLPVVNELRKRFQNKIYTINEEESFEESIINLLKEKGLCLVTAESCTGGLLAGRLVNVPGASEVFNEGFITYSNDAKMKQLGVLKETLNQYGAVSAQTAEEMAKGAAIHTGSDVALAVSGIAGPDGGTKEKPVGLVYIGCYYNGKTSVRECRFVGTRQDVREQSVISSFDLLRECVC